MGVFNRGQDINRDIAMVKRINHVQIICGLDNLIANVEL